MKVFEVQSNKPYRRALRIAVTVCLFLFSAVGILSQAAAQTADDTLQGTVADSKGGMIANASITVRNDATSHASTTTADGQGHFSVSGLRAGSYTVVAVAPGFQGVTRKSVQVADGQPSEVSLTLEIGSTTTEVTVDADTTGSIAAALAPMDALLDERSARTEITSSFIHNFTSPVSDFGEAVEMAPGTFTTNGNGVGLGQSSTFFRGFPDGDYDIDFDGIPFFDTNTPSHHSWAFFPSQFIGSIDFDRSPGTASTIGPTPFGGSIHLLSQDLSPLENIRGTFSGGSFHTYLYDGEYDSGNFGPGHRFNFTVDVHHLQSDGYQTFNFQTRNAGDIKVEYRITDKTVLTGYSGVIWLDANTPNFSATRCQMFGATAGYTCTATLAPFAGAGINFLNTDNSDPANYLDFQYNWYHVPTDFEYVGLHSEFGHNFVFDIKPYTYNYDNSEKYTNATPITEATTINGSTSYLGLPIQPCNVPVKGKLPCGIDKYNSYRKYGETSELSQYSKFGTLHLGAWYDWANTNRHQFPSDPLNNWADQALSNFNEKYISAAYQPFIEYDFHITKKLNITAGTKFSYETISTKQFADDGKTIGNLGTGPTPSVAGTGNPNAFITNGGAFYATLPSIDGNYRIMNNWSAYGQLSTGSIVPPSSTFDYAQSTLPGAAFIPVQTLPKQQRSTTYQTGTVLKLKRLTLDADFYHIRFQNSYSTVLGSDGEPISFLQPSSITKGFEAESNLYLGYGFSAYVNATVGRATYLGTLSVTCAPSKCTGAPITVAAPSGLWVQNTPSDTEAEGVTYQKKAWDVALFNKRVGTMYQDNGAYHNQATIDPFSVTNAFINYTIRTGGRFDQTKIRLSVNNLLDEHSITSDKIVGKALTQTISANGTTYTDPFNTMGPTPINGGDNVGILPGRSIMLSVTFGFSPKHNR
ncbi:TonB-dependent receptor [Granulicella mallensis]|uniref:TonB-dependent receptor n=1 Tax=Granulicella mallensis (strain ATCC BAA-1857 / DSM 23137 / MP5ACTX8) TaxID=682795 RepID=G8NSL1_GRAMM|nr:TonB-dependent receptor [Granulicella mallensis]AEU38587.1 TonB-dependent receptor [Granulicella mallensis MP5ACTX8]